MIRTTVTFPDELHKKLMLEAMNTNTSLSEVIVNRLENPNKYRSKAEVEERIRRAHELFDKMAQYGKDIDVVKAIHEDRRNRDLKKLKYVR